MAINVTREEFESLERRVRRNTSRLYQDLRATTLYIEQPEGELISHQNPTIYVPFKEMAEIPMGTVLYFRSNTNTPLGVNSGNFSILFTNPSNPDIADKVDTTYLGVLRTNRIYALTITTESQVRVVEFHDGALADDIEMLLLHKEEITDRFSIQAGVLTLTGGNQTLAVNELRTSNLLVNNNASISNELSTEYFKLPPGGYQRFSVGTDNSGIVTQDILDEAVNTAVQTALEDKVRIDARTPQQYEQDTETVLPNGILYFQVNTVIE